MAEQTVEPLANGGGVDLKAVGDAVSAAVAGAVAEAMKPVVAAVAELKAAQANDKGQPADKEEAKPLTLEDVGKLLDERLSQQQQSAETADKKRTYLADKLKDLPVAYQNQLGDDPAKWAEQEQAIRKQYQADFKIASPAAATPSVGGGNDGGTPPADGKPDLSKLNPVQKIGLGLKGLKTPSRTETGQNPNAAGAETPQGDAAKA